MTENIKPDNDRECQSYNANCWKILLALVYAYGVYAFIARGVWKYLILQQRFFFFDLERGFILFFCCLRRFHILRQKKSNAHKKSKYFSLYFSEKKIIFIV